MTGDKIINPDNAHYEKSISIKSPFLKKIFNTQVHLIPSNYQRSNLLTQGKMYKKKDDLFIYHLRPKNTTLKILEMSRLSEEVALHE